MSDLSNVDDPSVRRARLPEDVPPEPIVPLSEIPSSHLVQMHIVYRARSKSLSWKKKLVDGVGRS